MWFVHREQGGWAAKGTLPASSWMQGSSFFVRGHSYSQHFGKVGSHARLCDSYHSKTSWPSEETCIPQRWGGMQGFLCQPLCTYLGKIQDYSSKVCFPQRYMWCPIVSWRAFVTCEHTVTILCFQGKPSNQAIRIGWFSLSLRDVWLWWCGRRTHARLSRVSCVRSCTTCWYVTVCYRVFVSCVHSHCVAVFVKSQTCVCSKPSQKPRNHWDIEPACKWGNCWFGAISTAPGQQVRLHLIYAVFVCVVVCLCVLKHTWTYDNTHQYFRRFWVMLPPYADPKQCWSLSAWHYALSLAMDIVCSTPLRIWNLSEAIWNGESTSVTGWKSKHRATRRTGWAEAMLRWKLCSWELEDKHISRLGLWSRQWDHLNGDTLTLWWSSCWKFKERPTSSLTTDQRHTPDQKKWRMSGEHTSWSMRVMMKVTCFMSENVYHCVLMCFAHMQETLATSTLW